MDSNFWSNLLRFLSNWKRVDKFKELTFCDKKRMPLRSLNTVITGTLSTMSGITEYNGSNA